MRTINGRRWICAGWLALIVLAGGREAAAQQPAAGVPIRAFCVDFNWGCTF